MSDEERERAHCEAVAYEHSGHDAQDDAYWRFADMIARERAAARAEVEAEVAALRAKYDALLGALRAYREEAGGWCGRRVRACECAHCRLMRQLEAP